MNPDKIKQAGEKMQRIGCALTLMITIPLILTIFLGPLGLVIGGIIFFIGLAGMFKSGKKDTQ